VAPLTTSSIPQSKAPARLVGTSHKKDLDYLNLSDPFRLEAPHRVQRLHQKRALDRARGVAGRCAGFRPRGFKLERHHCDAASNEDALAPIGQKAQPAAVGRSPKTAETMKGILTTP
jgi:hypothetical protein